MTRQQHQNNQQLKKTQRQTIKANETNPKKKSIQNHSLLLHVRLPVNSKPWNWNWWNSCSFGLLCSALYGSAKGTRFLLVSLFSSAVHFNIRLFISAFRHLLLLLLLLIIIYSLDFDIELCSFAVSIVAAAFFICLSIRVGLYELHMNLQFACFELTLRFFFFNPTLNPTMV